MTPPASVGSRLEAIRSPWRSEKIQPRHLERLGIVYIRQSTRQQLVQHQESTKVQYDLRLRAIELGWAEDRVLVIDDDLGKSGTSTEGRVGFQRLVTEVTLDHAGIILGVEMSRLARSCRDWYQLLEACAVFGTLIADLDGIYDPAHYNDRLLLGLKGTMSEAELHILKQRMNQGRLNKARRGELVFPVPMGYVRRSTGQVALDPDEQVQGVVRLIFRKFEELGTLNAVLRYLVKNHIQMPVRPHGGPTRGDLEWHRPVRMTLSNMLRNPIYAGAYAYGRRAVDPRRQIPGRPRTGRTVVAPEECQVFLKDRFPAYISWDQFEANRERLRANQARADEIGVTRNGPALLSGLLVCGKCDCRMAVQYHGGHKLHSYRCTRLLSDYGQDACQSIAGRGMDRYVTQQVLDALKPAALELSLQAAENLEREREELDYQWQKRLERAAYEADRAARQYRAVEPENRLVARQLEREWEEKLGVQRKLQEEYDRLRRSQPKALSPQDREAIQGLAQDIPALWEASTTTDADRKEMIRQVVDRVVINAVGQTERVKVRIEWAGGSRTEGEMVRPVARLRQLTYYAQMEDRVRDLAGQGLCAREIADRLNADGYRPPKRREQFGPQAVQQILREIGLRRGHWTKFRRPSLKEDEWLLPELARHLDIPRATMYGWLYRGWLTARQEDGDRSRWIIRADKADLNRLRDLHHQPPGAHSRARWVPNPDLARAKNKEATYAAGEG